MSTGTVRVGANSRCTLCETVYEIDLAYGTSTSSLGVLPSVVFTYKVVLIR